MQGIFGASLISHFVVQGILFALQNYTEPRILSYTLTVIWDVWPVGAVFKQCCEIAVWFEHKQKTEASELSLTE